MAGAVAGGSFVIILVVLGIAVLLLLYFLRRGSRKGKDTIRAGGHGSGLAAAQMFCPRCGARFPAAKKFCDQCGAELNALQQPDAGMSAPVNGNAQDAPSGGFAALGFFIPLVGLILFLVWHDSYPLRARSAGKGALAGVITGVVLVVLLIVIELVIVSNLLS